MKKENLRITVSFEDEYDARVLKKIKKIARKNRRKLSGQIRLILSAFAELPHH